jgi:hypothetical protein
MFRRMLVSVLIGALVMGAAVLVYGVVDKGVSGVAASLLEGDRERRHRREGGDHD